MSTFEILDDRFAKLVKSTAKLEHLYEGCRWAEGPAYFPAHRALVWSDIPNDRMLRYDETSGKDPQLYVDLLDNVRQGAEKAGREYESIKRMIEVKVSYDRDSDTALRNCDWWAALALTPEQKEGVEDPIEMERLADANADQAPSRFICSDDPDEVVERIGMYLDLGFDDLVLHAPGPDQGRFLEQFGADVLPKLRERAG